LLKAAGLADAHGKPTWFTDGKPDLMKELDILGAKLPTMKPAEREGLEHYLFGERGAGAAAVLTTPGALDQMHQMRAIRDNPQTRELYDSFLTDYQAQSPMAQFRKATADFNIVMQDIGTIALPAVTGALQNFDHILTAIAGHLPGPPDKAKIGADILTGVGVGAGAGAMIGAFGGPVGAIGGALIGGAGGGIYGIAQQYMAGVEESKDRFGREVVVTGNSAAQAAEGMKALGNAIRGLPAGPGGVFPGGTSRVPPISLSVYLDKRLVGQAVSDEIVKSSTFPTGAAAFNGASRFGN
jgi:hypothetical protein